MKRLWGRLIAAAALSACAAGIVSACVHDDSSIFIHGVVAPAQAGASNGQACTYNADPTTLQLPSGVLDAAFSSSYTMVVLVGNQLASRASQEQGRTETNRVEIQGAIVTPTLVDGTQLHAAYTRSAAGTVDPSQGTTPGYAAIGVQVVDHTIIDPIAAKAGTGSTRLLIHIKMYGTTLGGVHVETNEFVFPLDVCVGCLVTFPSGAMSPTAPGFCVSGGSSTSSTVTTPCFMGQDQSIDCRLCASNPVCKPAPATVGDGGVTTDSGAVTDSGPIVDAAGGG